MAQQIINNGGSGLSTRTIINSNFTELYDEQANAYKILIDVRNESGATIPAEKCGNTQPI